MAAYRITFFKNLLSSDGHNFRCPQQVITTTAPNMDEAVEAAKKKFECEWNIRHWRLHADEFEALDEHAHPHNVAVAPL